MSTPIESITKVETVPHIDLVISNPQGGILAISGGESAVIPILLELCAREDQSPVQCTASNLIYPGQNVYSASRYCVEGMCSIFVWLPWPERRTFMQNIPDDSVFQFVVTY